MGQRFVRQPNGRLAVFSDIVDDFTWTGLTYAQALDVAHYDMGLDAERAVEKVDRGQVDVQGEVGPPGSGHHRFDEALSQVTLVHGKTKAESLRASMQATPEAEQPGPDAAFRAAVQVFETCMGCRWTDLRGQWVKLDQRAENLDAVFETIVEDGFDLRTPGAGGALMVVVRVIGARDLSESEPGPSMVVHPSRVSR